MSGWKARRFWSAVRVEPAERGFRLMLDGRPVLTPAKAELRLPTRAMAEAVAAEWQAVGDVVDPMAMPVTRSVNAAIDKVTPQFAEVAGLIAAYGGSDLLCYRAVAPTELIARQAAGWDPLLNWAAKALGAPLQVTTGIAPVPQPATSLAALAARVRALTPFGLTALHDLVSLSGSLILGLAATEGHLPPDTLWPLSRIDEDWQARLWGRDPEAEAAAARKEADFRHAFRFWALCNQPE